MSPKTLQQIRERIRVELDDQTEPYLWSNAFLNQAINEAQDEACLRARPLRSTITVDTLAGQPRIVLPFQVIYVEQVIVQGASVPLLLVNAPESSWGQGTPSHYTLMGREDDLAEPLMLTLLPAPTADVTLLVDVVRYACDMVRDKDCPEIDPAYHMDLRHWVKYVARSVTDTEASDPQRAAMDLALFEARFGARPSAESIRIRQRGEFETVMVC